MAEDPPKKKPFGFEVSYELFNAREERLREVLLIENPGSGQVLHLGIVNALVAENERITLNPLDQANASKYHFRLQFPQDSLALRTVGGEGADWLVSRVDHQDGPTDVYLSWRSPAVTLQPGEWLTLGLKGVSARPGAGAQVVMDLKWPKPETQQETTAAFTIQPNGPGQGGEYELEAQRPLNTLNRQGRPDCPLRVGFVGANQVLNVDNTQGTLRLRLANEAPPGSQDGTLRFVYDANEPTRASRLVVALAVGTVADAPWALGTEQQVKDITFSTLPDWNRSAATLSADKAWVEWTFTPTKEVMLAPRAHLELQLGKLVTLHPNGPTQLMVRYENVPGYWDGERVCVIEKAPLVFGQKVDTSHDYSSHVGIGNATPTARLYLRGGPLRLHNAEVQHEGHLVFRSDADNSGDSTAVQFLKKSETTALMQLSSSGDLSLQGNLSNKGNVNSDGNLTLKGNVSADGNLTLKGRAKDKTGWLVPVGTIIAYGGSSAPEGWLLCDGSTKSKTAYADLFAVIGDTYKGSSAPPSGQFRLPSLMARVPMGASVSSPHNYPLGTMGGEFTHTLTISEMPVHDHYVNDPGHSHSITTTNAEGSGDLRPNRDASKGHVDIPTNHVTTGVTLDTNGGGQAHNNMQPYTTVNFIIKY
ncbi:phage tail protein [Stigmatella aurantiaca]|uniref:Phage Tail Collar Domain family n=1 Tax=Stigmatella aurantiaca (strain DW4/3-1) TaxID=378806 RepID=Q094A8_STIAD|nr:tail fiber protein [Stigmatella aurantiaca]ADO70644.1 Phage Tail Collar domain protein [Stigmatella aurantiaca DW4/3-1]EAU67053.1 phage Tail Collar Domain family [Stigmatella aurantiaca DW4/3-1]